MLHLRRAGHTPRPRRVVRNCRSPRIAPEHPAHCPLCRDGDGIENDRLFRYFLEVPPGLLPRGGASLPPDQDQVDAW